MPDILFKKVDYSLRKLLEDIEMGEIGLPELQRPFVWKPAKVRDLFDSMYRGYPIGHVLFWENATADETKAIGTDRKQKVPRLLIVDGQQRLTSLYAVMKRKEIIDHNYKKQKIRIAFNPVSERFEVSNAAVERDPEWIFDISEIWREGTNLLSFMKGYIERLSKGRDISEEENNHIANSIMRLNELADYPITALEISSRANEEQVAEIFVRINSKGKSLNQADFILTLMSVFWDEGRADLEEFSRKAKSPSVDGTPSPFNFYIQPSPDQLLRVGVVLAFRRARLSHVYSILRGKSLKTGQVSVEQRERNFDRLQQAQQQVLDLKNWHEFLKCLQTAGYMSGSLITSHTAIMYSYAFWLIGKIDYHMPYDQLRALIARWFFMVALTGRYSNSPESTMEQDLARLRDADSREKFANTLDDQIQAIFTSDYWQTTLPSELNASSSRTPGQFAFYAAQCLLDAPVLYSNLKVADLLRPDIKGSKYALERHHLFPKQYLKSIGIAEERLTNQVANYALVEWHDNVAISNKPPSEYAPQHETRYNSGTITLMYDLHALQEGWYRLEYQAFLEMRRKRMSEIICRGYEHLRNLGQQIL